ncbi:MAG: hypothetical protein EXS39_05085 [Opitutaceae bacterium]|nr:hypothetical protein [Opitutaceae bacterium]
MSFQPAATRDDDAASHRRCGCSGPQLPRLSLGLWHKFGDTDDFANGRALILRAFHLGLTHVDLANNISPPPVSPRQTSAAFSAPGSSRSTGFWLNEFEIRIGASHRFQRMALNCIDQRSRSI